MFKEDLKNYNNILEVYKDLVAEDGDTAYELAKLSLINADRWNEIMLNASKLAKENGYAKTDLSKYCYQKYSMMCKCHEFCRVVARNCWENERTRWNEN